GRGGQLGADRDGRHGRAGTASAGRRRGGRARADDRGGGGAGGGRLRHAVRRRVRVRAVGRGGDHRGRDHATGREPGRRAAAGPLLPAVPAGGGAGGD